MSTYIDNKLFEVHNIISNIGTYIMTNANNNKIGV